MAKSKLLEINFKPTEKQFQAWEFLTDNRTTELGYGGGGSGGKTYLGCFYVIAMCLTYPGVGYLIGRKELTNLKRTTLITFYKVCQDYNIPVDQAFNYNQQTNIITFFNGSQIFLFDLSYQPSDPLYTRLGSLELTGAFIDESNEIDPQAINIVKTRLARRKNSEFNLAPKMLETFNPDKGHVYQDYYLPWKEGTLPEHRQFIRALPTDNPYTTRAYIRQLENSDKITRERLLLGNFEYDDDPAKLIDYDSIIDLFSNSVEVTGEKYIVVDVARFGRDKTVISLWDGLECRKVESYGQQSTDVSEARIKALAMEERVPYSHILIDEDGIGGGIVDHLRGCKGFIANSTPFDNKETHEAENFQNLKAQCAYKLAEAINSHRMAVRVDNEQIRRELIEELEQIKSKDRDKDGKLKIIPKDEVKEMIRRSPDLSDVLLMRMYFEVCGKDRGTVATQFIPQNSMHYRTMNRSPVGKMV